MSTPETPAEFQGQAPLPEQHPEAAQAIHTREKLTPRSGPIVAGTLVLVLCAYVVVKTLGGTIDLTTWLIATTIGLGALLLVVGLAVLTRGSRR